MNLDDYTRWLTGRLMGPPTTEGQRDQDWNVRTRAPHEVMEGLPAGEDCWTDYRGHERRLTRRKEHEQARRVGVLEPLLPGDRARVIEIEPGVFDASRW